MKMNEITRYPRRKEHVLGLTKENIAKGILIDYRDGATMKKAYFQGVDEELQDFGKRFIKRLDGLVEFVSRDPQHSMAPIVIKDAILEILIMLYDGYTEKGIIEESFYSECSECQGCGGRCVVFEGFDERRGYFEKFCHEFIRSLTFFNVMSWKKGYDNEAK